MPVTEKYEDKTGVVEWFAICYLETCRMRGPIRKTEMEALDAWNQRVPVLREDSREFINERS